MDTVTATLMEATRIPTKPHAAAATLSIRRRRRQVQSMRVLTRISV